MRKPKQPGSAPHTHGWALGVQGQLMLFLCGITVLTLGLVWGLITYGLQPMYNRNIQKRLERESSVIAGMIDSAGGQISSRDYGSLTLQNETFWSNLKTALKNGVINVDNCCIDISDNTCRSVQFLEGLYPCILHNSMATFGDNMTVYTPDTRTAILARHALYNEGSLYKIIESGGNRQMLVGCLTKDGSYGVIVSASLAQIETAAEVMRSVLIPVAIFLIALNLLVAALFSRWFTRPMRQLSEGAREIADGNYDVQVPVVRNDELGLLGREFNHMAQEVKRSAQLEKDILANVSHDLRTPLTLIKGYAETVRDITGDDKAKRTEQCSIIVDETDRLSALVNSVMELSKVSSGAEKLNPAAGSQQGMHGTRRPRHDGTGAAQPVGQRHPPYGCGRCVCVAGHPHAKRRLPGGSGGPRLRHPAGGTAAPVRPLLSCPPGCRQDRYRVGAFHHQGHFAAA